jgi:hypothetical protein
MVRVIGLLERIGLVYRDGESETPAHGSDTQGAAGPPPGLEASSRRVSVAEPLPPVQLDTATAEKQAGSDDFSLEQVYSSAHIEAPAHGFTVYRLMEMLDAEEFRSLDPPTRAKVISGMLKRLPTGAVGVEDIVKDAALRDRALDAFERFLADRQARRAQEVEEKNRALQKEIDDLTQLNTQQMEANRAGLEAEKARFERWRARKRAEEDRLFAAVAPFAEHNPITRDEPGAATPAPPEPQR